MTLAADLTALLHQVTRAGRRLDWDAWFPIAQAVAADPHALQEAIGGLALQEHYDLLDQLRADGGPVADYLLAVLAARPEIFDDDQVRAWVLADAAGVFSRRDESLTRMADQLRAEIGRLDDIRAANFDAARELVRLEAQRNALRAEQLDSDFREMSELEWEIARLETLRSRLQGYDATARAAHRDELEAETARLQVARRETEDRVAEAIRVRDEAITAVETWEATVAQAELDRADSEDRVASLIGQAETARNEIAALERDAASVAAEVLELSERRRALQTEFNAEQARLDQLQDSPVADSAERLREQLRQLYASLPDDKVDPQFLNRRPAR